MASENRTSSADLKAFLLKEGPRFSFIQALRLLRLLILNESDGRPMDVQPFAKIKIRPHLSLDFPASDIVSIEQDPTHSDKFTLTVTFLGLYGSSSPLPSFYTEDLLIEQSDGNEAARDFIDLFNTSLYPLLFKTWSKYQLFFNLYEDRDDSVLEKLFCMLGVGGLKVSNVGLEPFKLLRYIGLTANAIRSAEGLRNLLSDYLNEPSLRVSQYEPRVVKISEDQRCCLGQSGNTLGGDCYLGSELVDRMGKFAVFVSPQNSEGCRRLFPNKPAYKAMGDLVDFYLDKPLMWELVIRFKREKVQPARLGANCWSNLGWDTWLRCGPKDPVNPEVRV